jgi:CBS domain containing-hemolysin-like protein
MSDPASSSWVWAAAAAAVALIADLVLSTALVAVSALHRVALHRLGESDPGLRFAEELASTSSAVRLAVSACRQISLLGATVLATTAAALAGWPRPALAGAAVTTVLGVLVLETVLAHVVALRHPRVALRVARPWIAALHATLSPLLSPVAALVERSRRDIPEVEPEGGEPAEHGAEAFIEVAEKEGVLEESEGRMMRGIVDLGETKVREIMTPRNDIQALPAGIPVREALHLLRRANHTRLPVYRGTLDDVVGILHVRDLIRALEEGRDGDPITAHVRPAFFVPEVLAVRDLLAEMRTRTHVALAVDEYGGIAGLVSLEDILEEIVGDIRDEHDLEEALFLEQSDGSWLVGGSAHVEQLESFFGLDIGAEREFDTVGGLVVSALGRVPAEGESLNLHGLRFEIVKADPRRVHRVRIRVPPVEGTAVGSDA